MGHGQSRKRSAVCLHVSETRQPGAAVTPRNRCDEWGCDFDHLYLVDHAQIVLLPGCEARLNLCLLGMDA